MCPINDALQYGKEFGNRGQCNPTYFTVGNLVKHARQNLRDVKGCPPSKIIERYVFVTAGRLRSVPLRHLRHRVPQGPARLRALRASACCCSSSRAA
jgi:hypothetical protein